METRYILDESGNIIMARTSWYQAGRDNYTAPTAQNPDSFQTFENFLPSIDGTLHKRWGIVAFAGDSTTNGIAVGDRMYEFQNVAGSTVRLVTSGFDNAGTGKLVESWDGGGTHKNTSVFTVNAGATDFPRAVLSRGYMYFVDGVVNDLVKWDGNDTSGSGVTTWGITSPSGALAASATGSGSLTINTYRDYCYAYQNTSTGFISDISPFTRLSGPITGAASVSLTSVSVGAATESGRNTGTNQRVILATSDGGSREFLYLVGTIADNTTTTFSDTLTEENLLLQPLYGDVDPASGEPIGIFNAHRPPSDSKFPTRHKGRIYVTTGRNLAFSKSIAHASTSTTFEVTKFEESFPPDHSFPVTTALDPPTGLLSDGTFLYVGSKRGVYRIVGDAPTNFEPPTLHFPEVGVYNQSVWQLVYKNGVPIGAMWLTPDYRVILSDFNSYQDVSDGIRDQLRQIDSAPAVEPSAKYIAYDQYNFYVLMARFNSGQFGCWVFDLNRNIWLTWTFAEAAYGLFYWINPSTLLPQAIYSSVNAYYRAFSRTTATDANGVGTSNITTKLQSSWLDWGEPFLRKTINEMEFVTAASSGQSTITLQGATLDSEINSPLAIATGTTFTTGPLGDNKLYLAALGTHSRLYNYQINTTEGSINSTKPLHRAIYFNASPIHLY